MHGGSITVTSQLGVGSTFLVRIPLGYEHLPPQYVVNNKQENNDSFQSYSKKMQWWLTSLPQSQSDEKPMEISRSSSDLSIPFKVLFVDDNADMREYVGRLLKNKYIVELASDGIEGLTKAIASPPNLVLSDIMMPRLDGYGLLKVRKFLIIIFSKKNKKK